MSYIYYSTKINGDDIMEDINNIKNKLNPEQQSVVEKIHGPLQVVAGAGSGKTTVLMYRTANIINNDIPPANILLVTFTKKAANEIKERLIETNGDLGKEVNAGTFHSICLQRILKRYADEDFLASVGLKEKWEGMDQKDQSRLFRKANNDMTDEDKEYCSDNEIKPKQFEAFLSLVRSMGVKREDYTMARKEIVDNKMKDSPLYWLPDHMAGDGIQDFKAFEDIALRFWERYESICRERNAIDFDDILLLSCQLLEDRPEVSKKLAEDWKYIMLDEYQDTNIVQMRIMDSIAQYHKNICVVGDDQQSIYAFRGSNIGVIRGFKNRHPEADVLSLTYNYRSTSEILLVSNRLAGAMPNRLSNEFLKSPINKHNARPTLRGFASSEDEAYFIANDIKRKIRDGVEPNEIAVLYRNRGIKQSLEREFLNNNISYNIYNDTSFFDRKEVQDSIAMVRFIFRPWSALSAVRMLEGSNLPISGELVQKNSEKRGVSPHQFMVEYAKASYEVLGDRTRDNEDDKKKRYLNKASLVHKNLNSVIDGNNEKLVEKVAGQYQSLSDMTKVMLDKINDEYYSQGSIRKNEVQKAGTIFRKINKELKKDKEDRNADSIKEMSSEAIQLVKHSVNKSNEIRLFLETMDAMTETARICDIPEIDKNMLKGLPKIMRDALASTWETYLASSLEKHTKNRTNSDGDVDNFDNRVKNVEYVLDRFADKIEESIDLAENKELNFSEVIDTALDDLVMLVEQAPDENQLSQIQLMTMHASKGLEFKNTYVMGLVDEVMPGKNTEDNPARIEEELRLFYVAVTRAQENLTMSYSTTRKTYGDSVEKSKASKFLENVLDVVDYHKAPKNHRNLSYQQR